MSACPAPAASLPWEVRTMGVDDVAQIVAIETRAYEFPWTEQNFIDSLNAGYIGLVVVGTDNTVMGYTILMPAVDDLHILNLCIAPAQQGRGAGRRLLAEIRRVSLERGIHLILLEVRPSNTHAIRLYERFGFSEIGRRRNYYPARNQGREDAIVMRVKVKWSDVDDAG
jgi:ribosomal-protein-alanine N-acetyltransferase